MNILAEICRCNDSHSSEGEKVVPADYLTSVQTYECDKELILTNPHPIDIKAMSSMSIINDLSFFELRLRLGNNFWGDLVICNVTIAH